MRHNVNLKRTIAIGASLVCMMGMLSGCGKKDSVEDDDRITRADVTANDVNIDDGPILNLPDITTEDSGINDAAIENNIETNEIELETFSNNYFSMQIPKGFSVEVNSKSLVSYGIKVYDPKNENYCMVLSLYGDNFLKSQTAYDTYNKYYPNTVEWLVDEEQNELGALKALYSYNGMTNIDVIQSMGNSPLGGEIYNFGANSADGTKIEGIGTCTILSINSFPAPLNPADPFSATFDAGNIVISDFITLCAPEEDFVNWSDTFCKCISSIQFTDSFMTDRNSEWRMIVATSYYITETYNQISDMIMDSWEARNASYDISMQKYSDATLGYERVYDRETGRYYRGEIGWNNGYTGDRFVVDDSDTAYSSSYDGYIYKQ